MDIVLGETSITIEGYNKVLEESFLQAFAHDDADQVAKIFHIMLCDSGMTGNPKPDIKEHYVNEGATAKPKFLDAKGNPKKDGVQDYDFPLGLLDDMRKYLGLGEWDNPHNMVKNDNFYLSSLYSKYGYEITEQAMDYLEG